jgi:transposase
MIYIHIMARPISIIELTPEEKKEIQRRINSPTTSKRDHIRAQIIQLRSQGKKQTEVAKELNISLKSVNKWSQRFENFNMTGLFDKEGRGRKPSISLDKINKVITEATRPPLPIKRWSLRKMARHVGISPDSVYRIWQANDLKPHLTKSFKISNDPEFEKKFWDVIGLYLNPPERAIVLCCDEKSQCQALERSQPSLPLGLEGYVTTRTHDYKRHGTITLFAALNYLDGKLIGRTEQNHTHIEWLRFLKSIYKEMPKECDIHLIIDNYCTHKHEKVKEWIDKHPRIKVHFTPTGSSWMNLVERFFRDLSEDVVLPGSFTSVNELSKDILEYLSNRNENPKPYRWKADGAAILAKIKRARDKLTEIENQ